MKQRAILFDLIILNKTNASTKVLFSALEKIIEINNTKKTFRKIFVFGLFNSLTDCFANKDQISFINILYSFENFINFVNQDNTQLSNDFIVCTELDSLFNTFYQKSLLRDFIYLEPKKLCREDCELSNLCLINNCYDFKSTIKNNIGKWFNFRYSLKQIINNIELAFFAYPAGFKDLGIPFALNKKHILEFEKGLRLIDDNNTGNALTLNSFSINVLRYIKLMNGDFKPCSFKKMVKIYEK